MDLSEDLEAQMGRRPLRISRVATSDWAEVLCADMPDGTRLAVKRPLPGTSSNCRLEARMLQYLESKSPLPVPHVFAVNDQLLVMEYLEGSTSSLSPAAQIDAAKHIAALHGIVASEIGFAEDTQFGPIPQPNPYSGNWPVFFRDHRLLYVARLAVDRGRLNAALMGRVEKLAARLPELLPPDPPFVLLHGDLWQGNVIAAGEHILGFIDPAIYYGAAEMDLAFSTLFGTFGTPFFEAYASLRPVETGFFEERRDIYNLWPLLGHVYLFGGGYARQVEAILARFGA